MGKQVSTLKMTGSYGDAVGYIDKQGRVQMRSKATKFTDANTKDQRKVRTKFLAVSTLAKAFAKTAIGLNPAAKGHKITLRNEFVKTNYPAIEASDSTDGITASTDYTSVILAKGDNPNVSFGSPDFTEPLTVVSTFNKNMDMPGAAAEDLVYLVVFNPTDGRAVISTPVTRDVSGSTASVTVPNSWNGETVHVWGFTQGFATAEDRVKYLSAFNDHTLPSGEAQAIINKLASGSEFSNSFYVGNGSIS